MWQRIVLSYCMSRAFDKVANRENGHNCICRWNQSHLSSGFYFYSKTKNCEKKWIFCSTCNQKTSCLGFFLSFILLVLPVHQVMFKTEPFWCQQDFPTHPGHFFFLPMYCSSLLQFFFFFLYCFFFILSVLVPFLPCPVGIVQLAGCPCAFDFYLPGPWSHSKGTLTQGNVCVRACPCVYT